MKNNNYLIYEACKKKLQILNLNPFQYEQVLRILAEALKI